MVNKHVCFCIHTYIIYYVTASQNETVHEPFQHGLGFSVQWFDVLHVEVEQRIEASLQICRERVKASKLPQVTPSTPIPCTRNQTSPLVKSSFSYPMTPLKYNSSMLTSASDLDTPPSNLLLSLGCCAPILVQHCPVCFAGTTFGRPLSDGGDIHVAMDGNFHHRHRQSASDSPPFYDPAYFLPKRQVDAIGTHIEKQRKTLPKARKALVPNKAIDSCESSYEATDGKKQKASMEGRSEGGGGGGDGWWSDWKIIKTKMTVEEKPRTARWTLVKAVRPAMVKQENGVRLSEGRGQNNQQPTPNDNNKRVVVFLCSSGI